MSKLPLLFCSKLTKYYQYKKIFIKVLCNITLMIERGDIIAIIGSSGSGKSTFLHLLGGLEKPSSGKILFLNYVLNKLSDSVLSEIRNKHVGFIYQFHHLLPDFNIVENVAMPLFIGGLNFCKAKVRARNMLELVGLKNRLHHYLHELSGGESQRVAIARALINRPDIVLADEPTGSLDQDTTEHIFQLLQKLNVLYGTTFVIATHNLILAKKCHKIYVMRDGALVLQN